MHVLLIEDDARQAALLAGLLVAHDVEIAGTLRAAVELLRTDTWDAVVLDLGLPDSDGVQGVEVVAHAAPGTALIVYTGEDDDDVLAACLDAGADDVVGKPARAGALTHALTVAERQRQRVHRRGVACVVAAELTFATALGLPYAAAG